MTKNVKLIILVFNILPSLFIGLLGCTNKVDPEKIHSLSIIYSNSRRGEIDPCGCVDVQLGGIQKHGNLIDELKKKGSSILHLDGGDLLFPTLDVPEELKGQWGLRAGVIGEAYRKMGLDATTVGESDLAFGKDWYEEFVKGRFNVVTSNIIDAKTGKTWFEPYLVKKINGIRIGILGLINPTLFPSGDSRFDGLKVTPYIDAAKDVVNILRKKEKVDLVIALTHLGVEQELMFPKMVPGVDIIAGGHGEEEPKKVMPIGTTLYLRSSFEGRKIGVVKIEYSSARKGWINDKEISSLNDKKEAIRHSLSTLLLLKNQAEYKTGKEYKASVDKQIEETNGELKNIESQIPKDISGMNWYEGGLIPMLTETPNDLEIVKLIDQYKSNLAKIAKGKSVDISKVHGTVYATHQYCAQCHQKQYEVWQKSAHSQAWTSLVQKHQEFNLECMSCHTVGYKDKKGYGTSLKDLLRTVESAGTKINYDYRTVQCENCHGARSTHPFDKSAVMKKVTSATCLNCHDPKNSPNFNVSTYWVVGSEPKFGHMPICIKGLPN